jgi:hypothetical protein
MDPISLTTELEAINEMLNAIGEGQVSSLDTANADVAQCIRLLRDHSRKVQSRGWWFNREEDFTITPDVNGNLILPNNILKVDTSGDDRYEKPLIQRGQKLYDPVSHTYTFTEGVTAELVTGLSWDDLPQTARSYITACAGLEFTDTDIANEVRHAFTKARKDEAYLEMLKEDAEANDNNMLRDSYSGQEMLSRRI